MSVMVRGKIEIKFNVDSQKWEGFISIYLPADEKGFLVQELRSPKYIFGYSLHKEVGSLTGEFRRIWRSYYYSPHEYDVHEVLEILEGKLREKIDEIKEIYENNLERIKKEVQKEYEFFLCS